MSQATVCERVNSALTRGDKMTQGHLSKIENGTSRPSSDELVKLATVLNASAAELAFMHDLLDQVDRPGWWDEYVPHLTETMRLLIEVGEAASTIFTYDTVFVHGLLQTVDYARALFLASWMPSTRPVDIRPMIKVRMRRQERLVAPDFDGLTTIMAESVLHMRVGGNEVMRAQFTRLCEEIEKGRNIQLLPFGVKPWPAVANLTLYSFADPVDPAMVEVDTELVGGCFDDGERIAAANLLVERISSCGLLTPKQTLDRLHQEVRTL